MLVWKRGLGRPTAICAPGPSPPSTVQTAHTRASKVSLDAHWGGAQSEWSCLAGVGGLPPFPVTRTSRGSTPRSGESVSAGPLPPSLVKGKAGLPLNKQLRGFPEAMLL